MKRQIRVKEKGITLVALVVTITILLILAGISITALSGGESLVKKAQGASDEVQKTQDETLKEIDKLREELQESMSGSGVTGGNGIDGSLLAMYSQAIKDNCDNADGSCTREDHLHIGDYVDYKEPTTGSYEVAKAKSGIDAVQKYTLSATKNNVNWRVLGIDKETGGVKLIAADPIQAGNADGSAPYLNLKGAEAYVYGPTEMDKICEMYKDTQYATKARSINMDDIDQITGITSLEQKEATNYLVLEGSSQIGTSYSVTGYTPENWLKYKGGDTSIEVSTITGQVNAYAYPIFKTEEEANEATSELGEEYTTVVLPNTRIYNMLFANTEYQTGKAYWLASRGVVAFSDFANFGPGAVNSVVGLTLAFSASFCFNSDGSEDVVGLAVRPVIVLRSNVLAENIGKLADQTSTWPGVN